MATLTVMAAAPDFAWWPDQIDNNGPNDILSASATELKYTSSTGFVVTLSGSGFALAGGIATAGTVFDVMVRDAADVTDLMTITGLAFSFQSLYYTLFGGGGTGPDPFAALSALLAGDDTLIGSNESDQLGGYSPGNDTVSGNGSNDLIIGDPGNDILAGGSDFDTLSYVESFFGSNAFRGINLDVAAGTVIDCWGGKDTIKGFEEFEGSKFNDVMKGSNNQQYDENFRGLQGDDFIDGRGGWDVAVYWNDARFGGGKGIKANLATGKIIDGWGGTDTVRNIESIFGTMQNDSFVGNKYNNDFHGLAGKDSFNGGAGSDGLGFWLNDYFSGLHGVSVNLSRPSGQVIDDGFGNRETAIAMENVFGTNLADTITGSNLDNFLVGNGGNDRLSGLGNNDVIDASEGDDLVDGGPGNDRLLGGAGVDTLSYASARLGVTMSLARTGPQATGGAGTDTASGFEKLIGGAGADALTGNSLANVLNGNRGNDMLSGVGGNDTLNGGAGADVMKGGAGNDIYLVDNADDVVDESAAGSNGVDLVIASVSFSLVAGKHSKGAVENLTLAGAGAINGTGNALDNVITGNAVANVLRGGDGNDVIKGLGGADTIDGGHGIDTADYSERTGDVTVTLADAAFAAVFVNGVAEDHIRQIENVTGGSGNDQLTGDDNANVLIGGAGADTLTGGKGADVFVIGALADLAAGETIDGTTEPATLDTLRLDAAGAYDLTALTTIANIDVIAFSRNQAGFDLTVGDSLVSTADANGDNTENDLRISASRPMTQGVRIDASELTGSNHIMVDGTDFGGANTIKGGAGDDSVLLRDLTNSSVDGGAGNDKLIYAGSGLTLDLAQSAVVGFEQIDLTGTGNNALVVDQSSVINGTDVAAGGNHVLTVTGNGGDVVSFAEAKWAEVGTLSQGGLTLERYVFGDAEVRVEQGIAVSGPGIFNLAALSATQGFVIQDDGANDRAGSSVSSLGDINSDGFDDLIIGSPNASEAYVIFGTNSGFGVDISGRQVIDLATLSAGTGFIVQGASTSTVSAAGDVNGDGFDDLITGAPSGACILFGTASGFGTDIAGRQIVDLSTLSANNGFFVQSSAIGGVQTVSSVGDINGDGFTDMIFGLPAANDSGFESGEACIVFGSALPFGTNIGGKQVIDLTTLSAAQGFVVEGAKGWDHAGSSVSAAGDVNGDGVGDLIVAAPGFSGGETYVIFGSPSEFGSEVAGRQVINVSTLSAATGFVMQGDNPGASVSAAGDINGDGYDDLIVGALNAPPDYLGAAYVLFGTASGFGTAVGGRQIVDLTALTASEGFVIQGLGSSDFVGGSVSAAGDINGDGFDDLIIGAAGRSEAFVLFGSASGFGVDIGGHRVVSLATLSAHQGFVIKGDQSGDMAGWSVSSAGDVSHDGFDDLLVGAPNGSGGGYLAGQAFVLYGAPFGGSVAPVTIIGLSAAESLIGGAGNDTLAGGGGADAIRGGAGNDAISVPDLAFRSIDGGSGTDTLVFTGTGQTIDLTALADTTVKGIEAFDISGTGNYTIIIGALDTFHFSDIPNDDFTAAGSRNSFVVHGDAGDTLDLDGYDPDGAGPIEAYAWELTASGKNLDGSNGGGFDFYDLVRGSAIVASIAVDAGVSVVIA